MLASREYVSRHLRGQTFADEKDILSSKSCARARHSFMSFMLKSRGGGIVVVRAAETETNCGKSWGRERRLFGSVVRQS